MGGRIFIIQKNLKGCENNNIFLKRINIRDLSRFFDQVGHRTTNASIHGLRTPNEGINQRNLKFWADVADKICFGRT